MEEFMRSSARLDVPHTIRTRPSKATFLSSAATEPTGCLARFARQGN
jgi:hypothetical protein